MADQEKVVNSLHKKAEVINRKDKAKRAIWRFVEITMIILILVFGSFSLANQAAGNFKVNIGEGNAAITMSETPDFAKTSTSLHVDLPTRFTNISYTSLPFETLGSVDGQNNGLDYMQYTFYIRNETNSSIYYERSMPILNVGRKLDQVVRIMVMRNDETKIYAKGKEQTNEPEQVYYYDSHALFEEDTPTMTIPFINEELAIQDERRNMAPGEVDKYVIVIWIEGSDNECTDSRKGGEIKLSLTFKANLEADYEENHTES